ncbi:hypothetical protein [Nannocystis pusilla]|uniref:hypothetical protein n=1 Tax=Nannocystis pusilla TaxID=889268 RepID=UPI003BF071B0
MDGISQAILEHADGAGTRGVAMGQLVDALVGRGYTPEAVEQAIWALLGARRLTPSGFLCRQLRRRDTFGEMVQTRCYELLLAPWSSELDHQLDLDLATDGAEVDDEDDPEP